ncbi:MAG: NADP-dependent isocitrate dehydrogenase [Clostridia bacterium]|nr:NADP-dependent isocitrate dehydrogenase [Clostridia bacterium]
MMAKITYEKPIVEMQGDEMTRVLWDWIKEILIEPKVALKTEYYDLGLVCRDETDDRVTFEAGEAIKRLGVGVKCATITPNNQRKEEYNLKRLYPSPNGTIRAILDGTVFRTPILVKGITPYIPTWTAPITIARHAYGDVYKATDVLVNDACKAELVVTKTNGEVEKYPVHDFKGAGVLQGMHNTDKSITAFARSCFNFALSAKQDLWLGTKDTISKVYDGRFKAIFADLYENEFKSAYEKAGIKYEYTLIDDCVARIIRSNGGMVWACKNYDGDVMSDMLATAYGSLAMMSSVLVSPDGNYEYEAAHGTVTRHYYKYRAGEETSTNPVATIFAWSGALRKRGESENNTALMQFADDLERATVQTIESGYMTGDLALLFKAEGITPKKLNSRDFLNAIAERL